MIFNMGLTHLGLEISIYYLDNFVYKILSNQNSCLKNLVIRTEFIFKIEVEGALYQPLKLIRKNPQELEKTKEKQINNKHV